MGPPRACRASLAPPPASLGDRAVALPSAQARAALLSYCPPPSHAALPPRPAAVLIAAGCVFGGFGVMYIAYAVGERGEMAGRGGVTAAGAVADAR